MSKYVSLAAAAAVATIVSLGATTVQAATVITVTTEDGGDHIDTLINVSCDSDGAFPHCHGIVSASAPTVVANEGQTSTSKAALYQLNDSSEATEVGALNTLLGTNFTVDDANKTGFEPSIETTYEFDSFAKYIGFTIGGGQLSGRIFFVELLLPGPVELVFNRNGQPSGGLSHFTEIGVIPLPAGLVLFLSGLAGIGVLGRYKAKRRELATV